MSPPQGHSLSAVKQLSLALQAAVRGVRGEEGKGGEKEKGGAGKGI